MSLGVGFGLAFGGQPPVDTGSPVSSVGDASPITYDFADDVDGPLPGRWEFFILEDDGAGALVGALEPDPDSHFRVYNGLGLWSYTRQPATGAPFQERGVAASPVGIIQGRNAELAVAFVPPPNLLDGESDEFVMEVTAALRAGENATTYIGARARATWAGGVWTTPVAFEVVVGNGTSTPTVIAAATFDWPDPVAAWCAGKLAEVRVELRGRRLVATLSGAQAVLIVESVPILTEARPLVQVRVYNRTGLTYQVPASVAGIQLRTLRDEQRLGPAPGIEGHDQLEAPLWQTTLRLPMRELERQGKVKQIAARVFEVVEDFQISEGGVASRWRAGNRLRVTEPMQNQLLVPVVRDLAHARAVKEREGRA